MKVFSMIGRVALLLMSACLALACSKMSGATTQPAAPTAPAPNIASAPAPTQNPEDKMPRVSAEETKRLVDQGKAVIIDVRGTEAYKITHIKGAIDYPLSKIENKDFSGLPKDKRIIAYCT